MLNIDSSPAMCTNFHGDVIVAGADRGAHLSTIFWAAPGPAPQAFGNAGVGIMRGPGMSNFDFSFAKHINFDEHRFMQFRTEFFNAFNHANFNQPDIRADANTFGRILSASSARVIQFGLKIHF
jgi:hypothetical protein